MPSRANTLSFPSLAITLRNLRTRVRRHFKWNALCKLQSSWIFRVKIQDDSFVFRHSIKKWTRQSEDGQSNGLKMDEEIYLQSNAFPHKFGYTSNMFWIYWAKVPLQSKKKGSARDGQKDICVEQPEGFYTYTKRKKERNQLCQISPKMRISRP
jgi:hypothetical protein